MKKCLSALLALCLILSCATAFAASTSLTAIRINEFMASNGDTLEDQEGDSSDWIELYNTSDEDVNLNGLCISDGKKTLDKYTFGDVTIPAHGYLVVFASGKESSTSEIHLPFKLSAAGEKVVLSFQGVILDVVSYDEQEKDVSMSRVDDRNWVYTKQPTPGQENVF